MPKFLDRFYHQVIEVQDSPYTGQDYIVTSPGHLHGQSLIKAHVLAGSRFIPFPEISPMTQSVNVAQFQGTPVPPTATSIQIGNTDDRLPQREWCNFINDVMKVMRSRYKVWFCGPSEARAPWQCFCWVVDGPLKPGDDQVLANLAARYQQHSIAVTTGTTTMVRPAVPSEQWGVE